MLMSSRLPSAVRPLAKFAERRIHRAADQEFRARRARGAADDVDDVAMRCLEQRPEQPRQPHRGVKLQREAVGPGLVRQLEEFAALGRAGIVDQHVAALEPLVDRGEHLLAAGQRAQVAGNGHRRRPAGGGDRLRAFGEIGRAGRRQHQFARPRARRRRAIARPMPRLPPLTTTTLPSNSFAIGLLP